MNKLKNPSQSWTTKENHKFKEFSTTTKEQYIKSLLLYRQNIRYNIFPENQAESATQNDGPISKFPFWSDLEVMIFYNFLNYEIPSYIQFIFLLLVFKETLVHSNWFVHLQWVHLVKSSFFLFFEKKKKKNVLKIVKSTKLHSLLLQ